MIPITIKVDNHSFNFRSVNIFMDVILVKRTGSQIAFAVNEVISEKIYEGLDNLPDYYKELKDHLPLYKKAVEKYRKLAVIL